MNQTAIKSKSYKRLILIIHAKSRGAPELTTTLPLAYSVKHDLLTHSITFH